MVSKELVFIDTSAFKAIIDKNDDFHNQAVKIWDLLCAQEAVLVTTNYILDEAFTLIRVRCGIRVVEKFREILANSTPALKIIRITVEDESKAWEWFNKDWKKLSFTDCTSFSAMSRLKIDKVVSFDKHFQRAGWKLVK